MANATDLIGDSTELWFGVKKRAYTPGPIRINDMRIDRFSNGVASLAIASKSWDVGLMHWNAGADSFVFSLEEHDDGTADDWHGATEEFYYILVGEFRFRWGTDAAKIRAGDCESYTLHAGEFAVHAPGWKYQFTNLNSSPGVILWCKNTPAGLAERLRHVEG